MHRLGHLVSRVHINVLVLLLGWWMLQLVLWIAMAVVVQLHPRPFTSSLLYTIQISHLALILTAGAGATAALTGLIAKTHLSRDEVHHRYEERVLGEEEEALSDRS